MLMKGRTNLLLRIFISLGLTLVLSLLLFKLQQPYLATVEKSFPFEWDKRTRFTDLNSDGKSERISLSVKSLGRTGIIVYDHNDNIIDQYNIRGRYVKRSDILYGDYDNDSLSELYIFTYMEDSLFLNVLNVYNSKNPLTLTKYIEGCRTLDGEAWYAITGTVMQDVNDDGYKELYFSIAAGFTLYPRALFRYDLKNDLLIHSDTAGVSPRYYLRSDDLTGDGFLEIWGQSNAVGNFKSPVPYNDSSAWVMIYDKDLNYLFEPYEFRGYTSVVDIRTIGSSEDKKLFVSRQISTSNDTLGRELAIMSLSGDMLYNFPLNEVNFSGYLLSYFYSGRIYCFDTFGTALIFDEKLKLLKRIERSTVKGILYGPVKLADGKDYVMFLSPEGVLNILSPGLKLSASLPLNDTEGFQVQPVITSTGSNKTGFHLRTANFDYNITFQKNPGRSYIFIYALVIYILLFAFIWLIQLMQHRQEEKKRKIESQIKTLQLQSVKSQMSPHFIFNALNSISSMYIKGDTARADSFLTSFSRMIREVVDSSDRIIVKLSEEVRFVQSYLELQKVRYGDRLDYLIEIQDECSSIMIPSLSVHTFVENSIKHAFPANKSKMNIMLEAECVNGMARITIRDNGIGCKSSKSTDREGKGTRLVSEIFGAYNLIYRKKISYTLSDLSETGEQNSTGTLVQIDIEL
jgi:hypothetical protein